MRPRFLVPITALLLSGIIISVAAEGQQVRHLTSYHDGNTYEFIVLQSDLDHAPRWHRDQPRPPLAARSAMFAARQFAAKLIPGSGAWSIDRVTLEAIGDTDQWIYVVEFTRDPPEGIGSMSAPFKIPILMDVKTVNVKIEPLKPSDSENNA